MSFLPEIIDFRFYAAASISYVGTSSVISNASASSPTDIMTASLARHFLRDRYCMREILLYFRRAGVIITIHLPALALANAIAFIDMSHLASAAAHGLIAATSISEYGIAYFVSRSLLAGK